jgi:15-cis-phytoene synthase
LPDQNSQKNNFNRLVQQYNKITFGISRLVTRAYSTSFSIAVSNLKPELKEAIHSIYGFVRFADEIVDSFHDFDKKELLEKFENDYYEAIRSGISMNPILNSFQLTVKKYLISDDLIQSFLRSMKIDLVKNGNYTKTEFEEYIYGSAEAVGLMCLKVFVRGDERRYEELKLPAMKLGAAFQKVNFLRDIKNDAETLGREYFPDTDFKKFGNAEKKRLIADIRNDFTESFSGIKKLPDETKIPVLIAYYYFYGLLRRISGTPADQLISRRIRINSFVKIYLLLKAWFMCKLKLV